jgi:hypothetical protein
MHKSATKCNETTGKWCKNKHGASKIIDTFETYQQQTLQNQRRTTNIFGFSIFETRTEGNSKQSKIFLDFSNTKPKTASKANPS